MGYCIAYYVTLLKILNTIFDHNNSLCYFNLKALLVRMIEISLISLLHILKTLMRKNISVSVW